MENDEIKLPLKDFDLASEIHKSVFFVLAAVFYLKNT
jgi:hypothetical protein